MTGLDIFVYIMMGSLGLLLVFLFFAKKRMDANEPVFGWARKQHLQEVGQAPTQQQINAQKPKGMETIKDLLGIDDIRYGIFEKKNNEYCVIISTESVNYDLLSAGARQATILGYSSLFRVIRFPIQIIGQAVTQDMRKEEERFNANLRKCNAQTTEYNRHVISYIKERSEKEFRIARKVFYVISYVPQPSRMGQLTPIQREEFIRTELYQRAWTVVKMLSNCDINAEILDSLRAMEVMKRALNRDRMIVNPVEDVVKNGKEKLSLYVTADVTSLPGYEDLVYDVEEVRKIVQEMDGQAQESRKRAANG